MRTLIVISERTGNTYALELTGSAGLGALRSGGEYPIHHYRKENDWASIGRIALEQPRLGFVDPVGYVRVVGEIFT